MSAAAMTSSPMISPHSSKLLVGREHGGSALVATAHELEEEHGAGLVHGQVAELIDDEKRGVTENGEPSGQRTGGSGFLERCDELGEGAVVNPAAVLRRRDGETDREMGLSDTGRSQQDDVLLALDEAELVEILDLFTLDGRLEREVELIERLDDGQAPQRNRNIAAQARLGKRKWHTESGYSKRSKVETTFHRYKAIVG